MRKIVAGLFLSLDGVADAPDGWHVPFLDAEVMGSISRSTDHTDALLLGRRTYDQFAGSWPGRRGDPSAGFFNGVPKFVASDPTGLDWGPVTSLTGDIAAELMVLKVDPGGDILIQGSTSLVRSLLWDGLLDELNLSIMPVVVGTGLRLFTDGPRVDLTLADSTVFGNGVVRTRYRPTSGQDGKP